MRDVLAGLPVMVRLEKSSQNDPFELRFRVSINCLPSSLTSIQGAKRVAAAIAGQIATPISDQLQSEYTEAVNQIICKTITDPLG